MNIDIAAFRSDRSTKRWEWMWLTDLPDRLVVRSAFTYPNEKAARAAGRRQVKKLIAYCARLQSGEGPVHE